MRRTLPLYLSPLPFLLFALYLLFTWPSHAAETEDGLPPGSLSPSVERVLSGDTLAVPSSTLSTTEGHPPSAEVPELGLDEVLSLVAQAFAGKQWGLLGVLALVGLVLLLRKVGGRWVPWLDTPRGAVVLSLVGGTGTLLALALGAGQPLTLGLVLSCLMTAASASGLWSWGQTMKKAGASRICTPTEVANGTCRPS